MLIKSCFGLRVHIPKYGSGYPAFYFYFCILLIFLNNVCREETEALLQKDGLSEGLFLVRESSTSPGDFVLRHIMVDRMYLNCDMNLYLCCYELYLQLNAVKGTLKGFIQVVPPRLVLGLIPANLAMYRDRTCSAVYLYTSRVSCSS